MMKFIHTADVHLVPLSEPYGKRRLMVLREICKISGQSDGLIISGDLFHTAATAQDAQLRSELTDILSSCAKPVLIIPGNHDRPGGKGAHPLDGTYSFGSNVRLLSREPYEEVCINGTRFYGIPFQTGRSGGDLLRSLPPEAKEGVVLLHGTAPNLPELSMYASDLEEEEVGGDSIFMDADLKAVGAAYFAFGHIHKSISWGLGEGSMAAYAGSPDAVTVKEQDPRHVLEVEIKQGVAAVVKSILLNSSCHSKRKTVFVAPGAENVAIKDVEEFISAQPTNVRPAVYLSGLGSGRLLEDGTRRLEEIFCNRDPRPVIKMRAHSLSDDELAKPGILQDFCQLMQKKVKESGAPGVDVDLAAWVTLLGWLALGGANKNSQKELDNILRSIGGEP